jgi:hypothetical protein
VASPYGNQRREWDAGARFDFANPEYRFAEASPSDRSDTPGRR